MIPQAASLFTNSSSDSDPQDFATQTMHVKVRPPGVGQPDDA